MLYVVCELPVRRRCPAALRSVRGRTALPPRHQCSVAAATAAAAATRSSPSVLSAVKQFVRSSIHQRACISAQLQSILQRHANSMWHSMVYAGHSASSSSSSPFLPPFVPFKRTLCTTDTDLCSCPPSSSHGQQSTQTVETQRPYCTLVLGNACWAFTPSPSISLSLTNTNRIGPTYFPSLLIKKTEKLQPLSRLLPSLFLCASLFIQLLYLLCCCFFV